MKKLIIFIFSIVFLGSCQKDIEGCTDPLAVNYNASANTANGSCRYTPIIGDTYQGGILFYLDSNGGGLIAAPVNQIEGANGSATGTGVPWDCYNTTFPGANGIAIGNGAQNTIDIVVGCTTPGTAADICANLTLGGYSDWFLPSKDELIEMYQNKYIIGGFVDYNYWSSTSMGNSNLGALVVDFGDGDFTSILRQSISNVRAIRAF